MSVDIIKLVRCRYSDRIAKYRMSKWWMTLNLKIKNFDGFLFLNLSTTVRIIKPRIVTCFDITWNLWSSKTPLVN